MFRGLQKFAQVLGLCPALAGCAVSFTESDGSQRIIGLAEVEVLPAETFVRQDSPETPSRSFVGDVATVRVIGLSFLDAEDSSAIAFGYAAQTNAHVRNCYDVARPEPGLRRDCQVTSESTADAEANDGAKAKHYLGFVNLTLQPPDRQFIAGSFATHQTFGLSLITMGNERILSVGYHDSGLVALGQDVYVADMPFLAVPRPNENTEGKTE